MRTDKQFARNIRIGFVVSASLLILMLVIFFIGSEQKIFAKKNDYRVQLETVSGLAEGNPVKMSGVTIGVVRDIDLPADPKLRNVAITLMVDRKFAERIRLDSRARMKKLGLLAGDSYIDITPGSPALPEIPKGSLIPAQRQTNVEALISSGEDLVDNFVQISYSLKNILSRVDRGEGLLGELTTQPQNKARMTDVLTETLNKINALLTHVQQGRGFVGKLVYDDPYGEQLATALNSSVQSLQIVMSKLQGGFETNNGTLPALLTDPDGKKRVYALVDNLNKTAQNLAMFTDSLQTGEGLVPRLLNDKEYGDQTLREFQGLVSQLNQTVQKLNSGEGTAGKLITDPAIYESLNDILIGINESSMLRWLVRSRQQKGIDTRVKAEKKSAPPAGTAPGSAAPGPTGPVAAPDASAAPPAATGPVEPPAPEIAPLPPVATGGTGVTEGAPQDSATVPAITPAP